MNHECEELHKDLHLYAAVTCGCNAREKGEELTRAYLSQGRAAPSGYGHCLWSGRTSLAPYDERVPTKALLITTDDSVAR